MRIALLSNDDGIDAAGLAALRSVATDFFDEVWVVAPSEQMSQIGHRVTTDTPIRYERRGDRAFAISGTPADCVRVALASLLPAAPDWVPVRHQSRRQSRATRFRHIRDGRGGARGRFPGDSRVAVSHYLRRGLAVDWEAAASRVRAALHELLAEKPGAGHFWNVNLPHPAPGEPDPRIVRCEQERHSLHVRYEERVPGELSYAGDYHERPRVAGSDVDVCFGGDIAVTLASI